MLVGIQVSVIGLYFAPVFVSPIPSANPPQTIISLPVHTAVWYILPAGTSVVLVGVQLSVLGLYLPPVFKKLLPYPPQTIISLPVHTAVWLNLASGALGATIVAAQVLSVHTTDGS